MNIKHVSHRGLIQKNIKENTLLGFKKTFQKGYALETDLRYTKDNEIICFHDSTIKRFCGENILIKSISYSQLKKKTKNIIKIPTLNDLLKIYNDDVYLFLEIKGLFSKTLLTHLINLTSNYKKIVFISFCHKNLEIIQSINNSVLIGASFHTENREKVNLVLKKLNLFCFILNIQLLGSKLFNKNKLRKYFYTVKDKKTYMRFKKDNLLIIEYPALD